MKKKTPVTPDVVISGKQIEELVSKVINKGFKKNNKLSKKDVEFYKREVYRSVCSSVKQLMKEEYHFSEVRDLIFEHLISKYSWKKLVEMGIKE